jgi:hypothetical protein
MRTGWWYMFAVGDMKIPLINETGLSRNNYDIGIAVALGDIDFRLTEDEILDFYYSTINFPRNDYGT